METGGGNPSRGRFPPLARILIISTHGSEDPTRAGLAFFLAKGAVEAGHKPEIVLGGDAAGLARKRSGEGRVGEEGRTRGGPDHLKKKKIIDVCGGRME